MFEIVKNIFAVIGFFCVFCTILFIVTMSIKDIIEKKENEKKELSPEKETTTSA